MINTSTEIFLSECQKRHNRPIFHRLTSNLGNYLSGDAPEVLIVLEQGLVERLGLGRRPFVTFAVLIGQQGVVGGQLRRRLHQPQHGLLRDENIAPRNSKNNFSHRNAR